MILDSCPVQKTVMPKKEVIAARNLQDCLPSLPLKTRKAKKKIKVFLSRQFCASLINDELSLIALANEVMYADVC